MADYSYTSTHERPNRLELSVAVNLVEVCLYEACPSTWLPLCLPRFASWPAKRTRASERHNAAANLLLSSRDLEYKWSYKNNGEGHRSNGQKIAQAIFVLWRS